MNLRSVLYFVARRLGDLNAIARGPRAILARVARVLLGRVAGRLINRIR